MKKNKIIIFLIFIIVILSLYILENKNINQKSNQINQITNENSKEKTYKVKKVIDGDTIILNIDNQDTKIRLLGLNTPEAYAYKDRVVECFGKEASREAQRILSNKKIKIETDPQQAKYDKYGRLLAYVFYLDENGLWQNFAEKMIGDGYGYEYTYHGQKYKYQTEFKTAQKNAENNKLGLWADGVCEK